MRYLNKVYYFSTYHAYHKYSYLYVQYARYVEIVIRLTR